MESFPASSCVPSIARIHGEQKIRALNVQLFEEFQVGLGAISLIIYDCIDLDRSFLFVSRVDFYK